MDMITKNNYQYEGLKNPHKSYGYLMSHEFASVTLGFLFEKKAFCGIFKRAM